MDLTCGHRQLNKALSQTSRLIPSRSELPILSNVLLDASSGNLTLQATNLQLSIAAQVPADIKQEGRITVPAVAVQNYVSSLPPKKIHLKQERNRLVIECGETKASFVTMDPVDYPSFPQKSEEAVFVYQAEELARLVGKTRFAAAVEESRPVLTGVLVQIKGDDVVFVATDGFRLSKVRGNAVEAKEGLGEMIVPASALGEVGKLLGSVGEEQVSVHFSKDKNQVVFDFVSVRLASRLLEAEYPDYEKILPSGFEIKATINKTELRQAVETASIFAQRDGQTVSFKFSDDKLTLEAQSAEVGQTKRSLPIEIEGNELKIAFNARFLQEGLESIKGEEVVFEAKDSLSPTRWSSPQEEGYFHIVMPIRLEEEEVS